MRPPQFQLEMSSGLILAWPPRALLRTTRLDLENRWLICEALYLLLNATSGMM